MGFALKLRPEASLILDPEGARAKLKHTVLAHDLGLDAGALTVVESLDGTRDFDAVVKIVDGKVDKQHVRMVVRSLFLLGFLEGSGDGPMARMRELGSGAVKLDRVVLDGARFQCQGSGECCQNYLFGPLSEQDIARIEALPVTEKMPWVGPGPYWKIIKRDDEDAKFLANQADHPEVCVFRLDDHRCGLHAHFGVESKPNFCRTYPVEEWATLDGIRTYDKGSCASFARSARSGPPIIDDLVRLRPLMAQRFEISHPVVQTELVSFDFWFHARLQRSLLELINANLGTPASTLQVVGRAYHSALQALAACPFEAGAPETLVEELATRPPLPFYEPSSDPIEVSHGTTVLATICTRLLERGARRLAERQEEGEHPLSQPLGRELMQLLHLLRVAALARDGAMDDPYIAELLAVPIFGADCDEVLRLSLRQQLFGPRMFIEDRPVPALLRMAVIMALTVIGGRMHAAADGQPFVRADDLSRPHMLAQRVLDQLGGREIVLEFEADTWAVLEALPSVLSFGDLPEA